MQIVSINSPGPQYYTHVSIYPKRFEPPHYLHSSVPASAETDNQSRREVIVCYVDAAAAGTAADLQCNVLTSQQDRERETRRHAETHSDRQRDTDNPNEADQ